MLADLSVPLRILQSAVGETPTAADIDNINFKNFKSTLSDQQIFWIENNPEIYDSKIKPFLKENEFAFPAWQFATEAISALDGDGEVDWEEQVILDKEFIENDCL